MERVLRNMWRESNICIAIYATETAMAADPIPLSPALRQFVRVDNKMFQQELAQEIARKAEQEEAAAARDRIKDSGSSNDYGYVNDGAAGDSIYAGKGRLLFDITMTESGALAKRKRSGSVDSMASNMAVASDSDSDSGDVRANLMMLHHSNDSTLDLTRFTPAVPPHARPQAKTQRDERAAGIESPVLGHSPSGSLPNPALKDDDVMDWMSRSIGPMKPVSMVQAGADQAMHDDVGDMERRKYVHPDQQDTDGMPEMRERGGSAPLLMALVSSDQRPESHADIEAEDQAEGQTEGQTAGPEKRAGDVGS